MAETWICALICPNYADAARSSLLIIIRSVILLASEGSRTLQATAGFMLHDGQVHACETKSRARAEKRTRQSHTTLQQRKHTGNEDGIVTVAYRKFYNCPRDVFKEHELLNYVR